jgi:hypothetical protein
MDDDKRNEAYGLFDQHRFVGEEKILPCARCGLRINDPVHIIDALREQSECDGKVSPPDLTISFGNGSIAVVPFRSEEKGPIDGVGFFPLDKEHPVGHNLRGEFSPENAIPLACMHFTNAASVDIVIEALKLIKRDMESRFWLAT